MHDISQCLEAEKKIKILEARVKELESISRVQESESGFCELYEKKIQALESKLKEVEEALWKIVNYQGFCDGKLQKGFSGDTALVALANLRTKDK